MASYNKSSLDKTVDDLRDKRLLPLDFDKASQIELSDHTAKNKEGITFARSKTGWQILRPGPYRADSGQVEELIRSLKDAKLETGADTGNEKAFHLRESLRHGKSDRHVWHAGVASPQSER